MEGPAAKGASTRRYHSGLPQDNTNKKTPITRSAGNRLALGAGRRGRSEVASPSLNVFGEGGEPSPGVGGRRGWRGGAGVLGGSSRSWLWPME